MASKIDIQRICVHAKPKATNPDYFEWQTADICILVPDNDKVAAVTKARAELDRRHWGFVSYESKSTLIEDRVRAAGGEVWQAYQEASGGKLVFIVMPQHFNAGDEDAECLHSAKITEEFMDAVVADAGGRRLLDAEKKAGIKNADYLLGDFVFELKDLQEEGLEKSEHQRKIAELFSTYHPGESEIVIDPSLLSKKDYLRYLDILGAPIKTHVRTASKQVKDTKLLLARPDLRGGIIFLNTGFGSYPHELFANQVERYARKDSKQFFAIVSISVWSNTNGFDTYVFYRFSPAEYDNDEINALRDAFSKRFERMMTDLAQGKLSAGLPRSSPAKPIPFRYQGIDFAWIPPRVPFSWEKGRQNDFK